MLLFYIAQKNCLKESWIFSELLLPHKSSGP